MEWLKVNEFLRLANENLLEANRNLQEANRRWREGPCTGPVRRILRSTSGRFDWDMRDSIKMRTFREYRDRFRSVFGATELEGPSAAPKGFHGEIANIQLSGVVMAYFSATPGIVIRDDHGADDAQRNHVLINYHMTRGAIDIHAQGERKIGPGDVSIIDMARPFRLRPSGNGAVEALSILFSREEISGRLPADVKLTGQILTQHPGLGRLISQILRTFLVMPVIMSAAAADALLRSTLDLSALILSETGSNAQVPVPARSEAVFHRIEAIIEENFRDQGFSIEVCAASAGVSVRYVQKLFSLKDDTFGRRLLDMRLEHAAAMLRQPEKSQLSIGTIAFESGFADISHFGRSFRRRYEKSPTEWRRGGRDDPSGGAARLSRSKPRAQD
ncbi:MAG: helix-turn-helix domain-containing protein [Paracoccus sp. (in: a-proteobacteria)]|nr:helix-turn-helix domain-containing protein [Paracoccus sp. (in: a-proteobacteria)]